MNVASRVWGDLNRLVVHDRSGKSVVKAVLTFVIISVAVGTLFGTGFDLGLGSSAAGSAGGVATSASTFGQINVLNFGTTNFLPIPYFGGGGSGGPSVGATSTGMATVPYDPNTGEVLVDYTNPATGETLKAGTIIPKSMLNETKLYQRSILSDPKLPELNSPSLPEGWYNQKPPVATPPGTTTGTNIAK